MSLYSPTRPWKETSIAVSLDDYVARTPPANSGERSSRVSPVAARAGAVTAGLSALPLAVAGAAMLTAHKVSPTAITALGLISVTPAVFYVAVAAIGLSFIWHLRASAYSTVVLWSHLVAIVLLLHGLPAVLEHEPRFGPAWTHVGIANAIKEHGRPYAHLDARFSWPGFFAAVAATLGMSGRASALPWVRWAPVVANILYLIPLLVIARAMLGDDRRPWILAWTFVFMNWVDQDYLSPQGFAYFIFLAILATIIVLCPGGSSGRSSPLNDHPCAAPT